MRHVLDSIYLLAFVLLTPWLIFKAMRTGKFRRGLWQKFLGLASVPASGRPVVWFHGVSVGEVHLLQQVVAAFRRRHPGWECVISTTTDTGYDEACKCFPDLSVFYWPFDFSWAVRRALKHINPRLVVLAEGELWPNFLFAARELGVAVAVINGRLSPRSLHRYGYFGLWTRKLLTCVDLIAAQTESYAANYRAIGAPPARVHVTGSVKYDGVAIDRENPRTQVLCRLFGIASGNLIWVAGSTQAPEEEICLAIFRRLQPAHPNLRLFLVPRQKDRFDEVANLLEHNGQAFTRRSDLSKSPGHSVTQSPCPPVILVDTIGELGAIWGFADIAFVGGSLDGRRGGQNMIEPAAYGAAVLFGLHVWNFRDTAERLTQAGGAIQVPDAETLESEVRRVIHDAGERQRLGSAARELVRKQQGATERTIDCLDRLQAVTGALTKAA